VSLFEPLVARARSLDPWVVDGAIAVVLTGWAIAQPGTTREPVALAMTVAIAWRRRAPVAVLAVEVAGAGLLERGLQWPEGLALLIAAYTAALHSEKRLVVAALVFVAGVWLLAFGGPALIPRGLTPFLLLLPVWLAGSEMRRRGERAEAADARADHLEAEQEAALRAERARIARELHDVVTHSVSVMVLQTGAARQIMGRDESRAQALLESVEASGRSALDELRRLLGLLDDRTEAPLSPQPGVTEIPALVDQVRQAGLPVELCVEGEPRAVSGGVAVAAYRIVQEALTNVLKHADGAPTRVVLRWADAALELEILDRGAHGGAKPDAAAGRGLAGMRERAAMYGGTLDARAEPELGYLVRAHIPLEPRGA
jgi:signal transduction histidine kinase